MVKSVFTQFISSRTLALVIFLQLLCNDVKLVKRKPKAQFILCHTTVSLAKIS